MTDAVLMAGRGRRDVLRTASTPADADLHDSGIDLPPRYAAYAQAMQYLSPASLNDDRKIRDWLDVLELSQDPSVAAHNRGVVAGGPELSTFSVWSLTRLDPWRFLGTPMCAAINS
ncbi:MAG TPA: hypothetical protein VGL06_14920 [Pseudonocardiaceae bacterium]